MLRLYPIQLYPTDKSGRRRMKIGSRKRPSLVTEVNWTSHISFGLIQTERALSNGFSLIGLAMVFNFFTSAQTDFKGHALFEKIKPGTYWLMGMAETRAAFAFWDFKVTVASGENKLMLDQNNALYSK